MADDEHGLPEPDERRRTMPAGHVLLAVVLALVVAGVLNARGMHKTALSQGPGVMRDITGSLTGALAAVTGFTQVDQPRRLLKGALGRSQDDEIVGKVKIAAQKPAPVVAVKPTYTAAKPMRLYVTGDSLITDPGSVLLEQLSSDPAVKPVAGTDAHPATGLVQPEIFNWFEYLPQQVRAYRPNMTVATFGANDGLGFTGVAGAEEFGTPAWSAEYRRRVAGVLDQLTAGGRQAVFVGLPIPRDPALAERWRLMNQIQKEEAAGRTGRVAWVDLFARLADSKGRYTDYLRDAGGGEQLARTSDGIHYEQAGSERVVAAILEAMRELANFGDGTPGAPAVPAAPAVAPTTPAG
ncbi:MAG: DUF459 domain-containing protein [Solirubrobacterales bacterium]